MTNQSKCFSMYEIISKKRDRHTLTTEEIDYFVSQYVNGTIPDYQAAALLMAIYIQGLDNRELTDLTRLMMNSGDLVPLEGVSRKSIDKHSTGGVGDKISFIVSPLVAACGVNVPMLSGRSLGHTGGTLDKLESIPGFNVFLKGDQFRKVLSDVGMVICGQTENIVPADRKLYALRDATATVNNIPLISASIMSKKLALGSDGIILDVKTGSGAFKPKLEESINLCKTMVAIGEEAGRTTIGLITDMDQPLGYAVGNSLEIIESIECLKDRGPKDVMEVTFALGAAMLVAAGAAPSYPEALKKLEAVAQTTKPLEVFKKFIQSQGGNPAVCDDYDLLPKSAHQVHFTSDTDGYIEKIDAFEIGMTAIDIGAGRRKKEDSVNHSAGFVFHKKVGDKVQKDDIILTIHSDNPHSIPAARERLAEAITISPIRVPPPEMILYRFDKDGMVDWNADVKRKTGDIEE